MKQKTATFSKRINPFFLGILFCLPLLVFSQKVELKGHVTDKYTGEEIAFAHVFFKGTQVGTTTNFDGDFVLKHEGNLPNDTLLIQCLGYKTLRVFVGSKLDFNIELETDRIIMQEIVVVAGENPAFAVMDKIIGQKEVNDPDNFDSYTCNEYSKIRFDLNHFTEKTKRNILLRPFDYIWDNSDTTEDGVPYLPVLLVEKSFKHLYQKSPKKQRSILEAKKVTGLPGPKILEFVEDLYFTPNVYSNYIVILDRNFPSPLNDNYKSHYNYFLDSAGTGDAKVYNLVFRPKQKRTLAFTGDMSVDAQTFAVKSITFRFDIMANVNFVRSYLVTQEYEELDDGKTVLAASHVLGDFTVLENQSDLTGFFGRKKSFFTEYKINESTQIDTIKGSIQIVEAEDAVQKDEEYWTTRRPDSLDQKEKSVGEMIDRLEKDPQFIIRKNFLAGMFTGYIPAGKFDIGNFYTFYSYNFIERSRVKFGFRTSKRWESRYSGNAYVAYGFNDVRWKYGVAAKVGLGKKQKSRLGFSVSSDIEELGRSFNAMSIDHLFTSLFLIGDVKSRVYADKFNGYFEQEISTGLVGRIGYFYNSLSPTDTVVFRNTDDNGNILQTNYYSATGVEITLKYSWQNKDLNGEFYNKEGLKKEFRKFPDLRLTYSYASNEFGGNVNYQKIKGAISQYVRTRNLGYFQYYIEVGKTYGTVPYPFLDVPFANQLVFNDDVAFNLMKYLEFAADEYISANIQHHFDGAILDRIPLVNLLKWRSFVFAKGYWGSLSTENQQTDYVKPPYISAIDDPYIELGFGLENIFKFARMDFSWRLNETTLPDTYRFIVKPSFVFAF